MALVKVISDNLFSGANLQKLEVGAKVEVSEDTANKWKAAGLVEIVSGGDRKLEVATPGDIPAEQADTTAKSKKAK
ncbi:hypothetical protein ISX58_15975 [Citrobacter amalonaticus]|uniref:hypothetical protein n=1 Tax=Citrobacter amalonaticus TaxID=35703 RepID=UPI00188AFE21|nr:hypothetical protein [Citrobacter amalonaticus]QPB31007.1 hypothetical protein ISX58_15975 [Citrobacter amalonaticus]HCB1888302.1 hypothetical protein [Citrobacter amalonaticus]HCB1909079.1 hypothetical protein [Citrobacter amalonaticus]